MHNIINRTVAEDIAEAVSGQLAYERLVRIIRPDFRPIVQE